MEEVSLLQTEYDDLSMQRAMEGHFDLLRLEELFSPSTRVVLKLNLLLKRVPEAATTTHPALVKAIVRKLRALGVKEITLADSPGGPYTKGALEGIYRVCGIEQAAGEAGALLNFDTSHRELPFDGETVKSFPIIKPVADADVVINVAKLKTHCMTLLSGGVKNLFGCVPGLAKPEFHCRFPEPERFCSMLVDLSRLIAPAITFVDAVEAMEGDGPSGGRPLHAGVTLCSRNVWALDMLHCAILGVEPEQVLTVREAVRRGISPTSPDEIAVLGQPEALGGLPRFTLPRTKQIDFSSQMPRFLRPAVSRAVRWAAPRPVIRASRCVGCAKCAESCPAHTIEIRAGKARIDYRRCQKCYCCHEMCPVRAIDISRMAAFRF